MVGWQRHLNSITHIVGNTVLYHCCARISHSRIRTNGLPLLGRFFFQGGRTRTPSSFVHQPYSYNLQGICSSKGLYASSDDRTPISSPLLPTLATTKVDNQAVVNKPSKVQAVQKGIKQSPKKVNLVAALVRGMRVEDALLQMQVTVKRAAVTVYKVIHSARANAVHNHGLDPDRLIVDEAFVGKGFYKKRISYHSKGRSGIKVRPECRLTVVVREITPEEEAKIARLKVTKSKLTKKEKKLVPHKLIETSPRWGRKRKEIQEPVA